MSLFFFSAQKRFCPRNFIAADEAVSDKSPSGGQFLCEKVILWYFAFDKSSHLSYTILCVILMMTERNRSSHTGERDISRPLLSYLERNETDNGVAEKGGLPAGNGAGTADALRHGNGG